MHFTEENMKALLQLPATDGPVIIPEGGDVRVCSHDCPACAEERLPASVPSPEIDEAIVSGNPSMMLAALKRLRQLPGAVAEPVRSGGGEYPSDEDRDRWLLDATIQHHRDPDGGHTELRVKYVVERACDWVRSASPAPPQTAQVPEGWKLVPVEPTREMILAAYERNNDGTTTMYHKMYAAMLDASPAPQPGRMVPAVMEKVRELIDMQEEGEYYARCEVANELEELLASSQPEQVNASPAVEGEGPTPPDQAQQPALGREGGNEQGRNHMGGTLRQHHEAPFPMAQDAPRNEQGVCASRRNIRSLSPEPRDS